MDLGISGKNALVCGASKGLGRACAEALAKEGVNVTLGLPLTRTSPDHGTAFDIAGLGKADPSSLLAAIRAALPTLG